MINCSTALLAKYIPTESPKILVDEFNSYAIFGRLGKKIFIVSAEILASNIRVKICGGVDRLRNRTSLYFCMV